MSAEQFYRHKADECVAAAKAATLNEERARHYALAAYYMRLAMDELKLFQSSGANWSNGLPFNWGPDAKRNYHTGERSRRFCET
jgi:hypothetical protein